MVKVQRSTVIDAPVAEVWAILRDFNGHDRWHPAVARSRVDGGLRSEQVGAVRNFSLTGGEHLREQLLTLSDKERHLRYAIVESEIPLHNYVAEVKLKPVTDGDRTFWSWSSRFETPPGQEDELAELVAKDVYEAGFEAIRQRLGRGERASATARPAQRQTPVASSAPAASGGALPGIAMTIARHGGPEEFRRTEISAAPPGPGQVRLRQSAVGVNFIDVYCRSGYFDLLTPPGPPGMEAAGTVVDVGPGVTHLRPGQRAAYACPPVGAYASVRTLDAALVIPLPEGIDLETAAAGLLKGISAEFLLHRVHKLQAGETALIYAPAGGVGRILCQWAKHLGARVIGATSSEEKARIARAAGAQHVILPGPKSLEEQVMELTEGRGADVIYDAVGRDSFAHSLGALAPCGHLISFGQASGDIGSWDIGSLAERSVTLSRPNYGHYTDTPEKIAAITERLFDALARRIVTVEIDQRYPLTEAAAAHRALEARETTGSTILIPDSPQGETA
ncbi:MAG: SRPBCC family protein [Rhodovibrionaceae bacterium]